MCKELPVIPANEAVDPKRIIRKNGGLRRKRGTRGRCPPPPQKKIEIQQLYDVAPKTHLLAAARTQVVFFHQKLSKNRSEL
jgi:hypothetical protein